MSNNNDNQGVKERIKGRLLQATGDDDLKQIRQELKDAGEKPGSIDACVSELRKKGNLKFGATDTGSFYPIKVGKGEIIAPEAALQHIRLQDGDYKLGFIDGMGTLIMAARYNQLLAASQAETLSNQLKIMEESKKGSAEVAQEAAARAVAGMMPQVLDMVKQSALASSPNPIMTMMTQAMQPMLSQVMGNLMTMFQPKPGQPSVQPPPSQPGVQPAPGYQQTFQQPTEEEVEEAFR